jgi:uncharacterized lipoprotein YehR (DUF1307 family)
MMKSNRVLSTVVAVIASLSLAACGGKKSEDKKMSDDKAMSDNKMSDDKKPDDKMMKSDDKMMSGDNKPDDKLMGDKKPEGGSNKM